MKRILSLLLALCMALSLIACGQQEEAPAQEEQTLTVEPTVEPEPEPVAAIATEPAPNDEAALAIAYGFVPEELQRSNDQTITSGEFCDILSRVVAAYDEKYVPAWENVAATSTTERARNVRSARPRGWKRCRFVRETPYSSSAGISGAVKSSAAARA